MKSIAIIALCAGASLTLQGCVVRTAAKVATAPVKATSKVADWATVSGDEADRSRGRELRKKCKEKYDPNYCEKN